MESFANPQQAVAGHAPPATKTKTVVWPIVFGVLLSAFSTWLFIVLWDLVTDRGDGASRLDHSVLVWMRVHQSPWLTVLARVLAWMGSPWITVGFAFAGVVIGLFNRHVRGAAWTMPVAVAGAGILIQVVKVAVHRKRPDAFAPLLHVTGYSFPSGHSLIAMVVYGLLGYFAIRLLRGHVSRAVVAFVTIAVILAIGVSRVYVGVHYPTDVLAGWSAGIPWLIACMWLHEKLTRIWSKAGEPVLPESANHS